MTAMTRLLPLLAALLLALPALAQDRHALIIGIDAYVEVPQLRTAVNDARAVARTLEGIGFRTDLLLDPDGRTLMSGLSRLVGRVSPGDDVVFYFAGHGIELAGQTYLLPADVPADSELVVRRQSLMVSDVLHEIQDRGARVTLLILDACRDNPFQESTLRRSLGRTRGLGPMQSPPEGSFILYSAATGRAALDSLELRDRVTQQVIQPDPHPNSVFTRALLPRLEQPGLSLTQIARDVRIETRQLAQSIGEDQFPAFYDQLEGEFFFVPAAATAAPRPVQAVAPPPSAPVPVPVPAPAPAPPAPVAAAPVPRDCTSARSDWAMIEALEAPAVVETFIAQYAHCPLMVAIAQARLDALRRPAAPPAQAVQPAAPPAPIPAPAPMPGPAGGIPHEVVRGASIGSYWDHNGSRMGLIASGNARSFVYVAPRAAIAGRGVVSGTLLFDGRRDGQFYHGTARIFARPPCGAYTYAVSGPVSPDQRAVTLHGRAPLVNERCQITGYRDDTLVFTLE